MNTQEFFFSIVSRLVKVSSGPVALVAHWSHTGRTGCTCHTGRTGPIGPSQSPVKVKVNGLLQTLIKGNQSRLMGQSIKIDWQSIKVD